jgi:hypothetical protein
MPRRGPARSFAVCWESSRPLPIREKRLSCGSNVICWNGCRHWPGSIRGGLLHRNSSLCYPLTSQGSHADVEFPIYATIAAASKRWTRAQPYYSISIYMSLFAEGAT